jgi:hypothetical protein
METIIFRSPKMIFKNTQARGLAQHPKPTEGVPNTKYEKKAYAVAGQILCMQEQFYFSPSSKNFLDL